MLGRVGLANGLQNGLRMPDPTLRESVGELRAESPTQRRITAQFSRLSSCYRRRVSVVKRLFLSEEDDPPSCLPFGQHPYFHLLDLDVVCE